jgi:hypothetical protein
LFAASNSKAHNEVRSSNSATIGDSQRTSEGRGRGRARPFWMAKNKIQGETGGSRQATKESISSTLSSSQRQPDMRATKEISSLTGRVDEEDSTSSSRRQTTPARSSLPSRSLNITDHVRSKLTSGLGRGRDINFPAWMTRDDRLH